MERVHAVGASPLLSMGADPTELASRARAGDARAIERVAADFEGLFVSLLIKQMRQTLEPGTLFSQDNGDVLGGLFDTMMGQHLSHAGMFGIARMLKEHYAQRGAAAATAPTGAGGEGVRT